MPHDEPAISTMPRIAYRTFITISHIELKLGQLQGRRGAARETHTLQRAAGLLHQNVDNAGVSKEKTQPTGASIPALRFKICQICRHGTGAASLLRSTARVPLNDSMK